MNASLNAVDISNTNITMVFVSHFNVIFLTNKNVLSVDCVINGSKPCLG